MLMAVKKTIQNLLSKFGFTIIKKEILVELIVKDRLLNSYDYFKMSKTKNISALLENIYLSHSQIFQDLFVLDQLNFKTLGYFIEFGAASGKDLSNTYILEKEFGWTGIVAEPSKGWHKKLEENRNCNIDKRCVWSNSGEQLEFSEVTVNELSTITKFKESDSHNRKSYKNYFVETISLNDLLKYHNAPNKIDYLSIDTEGSEFEILQSFDFSKYEITVITVEHNYTDQREKIYTFLESKGYQRVFKELSKFDDWYILDKKNRVFK